MFEYFEPFNVACVFDVRPSTQVNKVSDSIASCQGTILNFALDQMLLVLILLKHVESLLFGQLESFKF